MCGGVEVGDFGKRGSRGGLVALRLRDHGLGAKRVLDRSYGKIYI